MLDIFKVHRHSLAQMANGLPFTLTARGYVGPDGEPIKAAVMQAMARKDWVRITDNTAVITPTGLSAHRDHRARMLQAA